jgi:hypothetical protein
MARRLGDELNEMRFQDNLSGSEIVLFYRMPTTKERIGYANESFRRTGKKVINRSVETRMKYGAAILKGFREGDFEIESKGEYAPISCDSKSEHYFPDWHAFVVNHAPDLIEYLAIRVFDIPVQLPDEDEEETETGEDLEKN